MNKLETSTRNKRDAEILRNRVLELRKEKAKRMYKAKRAMGRKSGVVS